MEAHTERRWVCKEPTTQYGWVRLGMESINSHKSGWRSHTLTVLLILSIPMAWAARCALVCVQKSTHTQLREESYAQYHSHKYIVYINIYATTHINQDSVSDTQPRKRSTKNQHARGTWPCKATLHSSFPPPTHPYGITKTGAEWRLARAHSPLAAGGAVAVGLVVALAVLTVSEADGTLISGVAAGPAIVELLRRRPRPGLALE